MTIDPLTIEDNNKEESSRLRIEGRSCGCWIAIVIEKTANRHSFLPLCQNAHSGKYSSVPQHWPALSQHL